MIDVFCWSIEEGVGRFIMYLVCNINNCFFDEFRGYFFYWGNKEWVGEGIIGIFERFYDGYFL